jgi:hypothetical protein
MTHGNTRTNSSAISEYSSFIVISNISTAASQVAGEYGMKAEAILTRDLQSLPNASTIVAG